MKKQNLVSLVAIAAACLWLDGCSKAKTSGPADAKLAPESSVEKGEITMKLKWLPNKRYSQELSLRQTGKFEVPGSDQTVEQRMTMTQDYDLDVVKTSPDGSAQLKLVFTGQKMESSVNGKTNLTFNSKSDLKDDGNNPAGPIMRKMIGAGFSYDLDADGKVQKINGLDEFYERIGGADAKAKLMVKSMMSEDTLKQMAVRGLGLPEKPVKVGDQWPVKLDVSEGMFGTLMLDLQYTFKGWETREGKRCAVLTYAGAMTSTPLPGGKKPVMGIDNGKITGTSWFDPELGMVMDTSSEQTMNLKGEMQGKKITSVMDQATATKVLAISDLPKQ